MKRIVEFRDPESIDTIGRLTVTVLVATFAILVFYQAIRPLMAARRDLDGFRDAVEILADAEGSVDRLDQEIETVTAKIAESRALLPKTVNLDGFLEYLGTLTEKTGTRVGKLVPKETVEHRLYMELPLEVQVSGPFLSVYELIVELEHGSRLCRVDGLLIDSDVDAGCRAQIQLSLFFAHDGMG